MERELFEQIYKQYWKELLRYALSYCADRRQSEEIVQDVFLSLWMRRHDFVMKGDIRHYLYRSIKNKVFDFFRNESKKQTMFDELRLQACDFPCFTEQEVSFNEVQSLIGHAVRRLPCRCREIYEMSREQGFNNKEIARQLSISEKTVEQHLTKALRHIRLNLNLSS